MQALFRSIPAAAPRGARFLSVAAEDASVKTLGSGVKVGAVAMQGETATVTAWVNAGSRFESAEKNGVAHLHQQAALMSKAKEINELGGMVTGHTTREHIVFEARVLKEHVPKATALLGELMKPVGDVTDAKAAVQGMIAEASENPGDNLMEHLYDAAFLNTSMSMPIKGTTNTVAGLSADDVSAYTANFTGDRVAVAAAGAFDKSAFESAAETAFGSLKSGSANAPKAIFTGSDIRLRFDSMDSARVAFVYETSGCGSPDMYPLMVMQAYLGSHDRNTSVIPAYNRTSKLAIDLGEQQAAPAYTIINHSYSDTGVFGVLFQAPDNALEDTMWYSLHNLVRMCHSFTDEEVAFAKTQLKAQVASRLSSTSGAAEGLARSLSYAGRNVSVDEIMSEIDNVTTASVRATAMKVINDQEHALAAAGPIYELPDINWIRRRSFWLRY